MCLGTEILASIGGKKSCSKKAELVQRRSSWVESLLGNRETIRSILANSAHRSSWTRKPAVSPKPGDQFVVLYQMAVNSGPNETVLRTFPWEVAL